MALYTIIHIYEVPAENQYQATDELMAARGSQQEKNFLVKVIVRKSGAKPGQGNAIDGRPPVSWKTLFKRQLTGK
jgi:hypothetical protein